jgi:LPXTG-site transpeptidase (sortase) family protein
MAKARTAVNVIGAVLFGLSATLASAAPGTTAFAQSTPESATIFAAQSPAGDSAVPAVFAAPSVPPAAPAPADVPLAAPAPADVPLAAPAPADVPLAAPGPGFSATPREAGTVPASVVIPRLSSRADIVTLGMQDPAADLPAPTDPDTIGWYDFSGKVGIPGNAVLVGHVDWGGRLRAFGRLKDLREGDEIQVVDANERRISYSVAGVQSVDANAPTGDFITQHGPDEELTLITCGGEFDHRTHQYLRRVIVRALRTTTATAGGGN